MIVVPKLILRRYCISGATMDDLKRIWSQKELREYLIANNFPVEQFGADPIPQGAKYIDFHMNEMDAELAKEIISRHPAWQFD